MNTTVKHKGSARIWEGPLKNWNAHSEVIIGWCDGREVEYWQCVGEWLSMPPKNPIFDTGSEYRLAKREPKPGEVWKLGKITLHITEGKLAVDQSGGLYDLGKYELDQMKYITPDLRTYYAREFLKEVNECELRGNYLFPVEHILKQAAQLENEK